MARLTKSLDAWGMSNFKSVMKAEIEQLNAQCLPLQAGLSQGSYVSDGQFSAMILDVSENAEIIFANAGIFYTSIIAGRNCADDPSPIEEQTEYCEIQFEINKETAEATVKLLS
ncbi:MAG: hypothetical protein IMF01_05370 [Proteobacteria bacterium]|nr:hypothetical protein [Pseudomonadota bacterium]